MKIAGITIDKFEKVALLTSAIENGYTDSLMLSFIGNGELVAQTVFRKGEEFFGGYSHLCNRFKGYTWKTTLRTHKNPVIANVIKAIKENTKNG